MFLFLTTQYSSFNIYIRKKKSDKVKIEICDYFDFTISESYAYTKNKLPFDMQIFNSLELDIHIHFEFHCYFAIISLLGSYTFKIILTIDST